MGFIETHRDPGKDLTIVKIAGKVTVHDIEGWLERYYTPEMTTFILLVVAEVDGSSLTAEESMRLLQHISEGSGAREISKIAVVVESALAYVWGKVAEKYPSVKALPFDLRTFHSVDEAQEWLGA